MSEDRQSASSTRAAGENRDPQDERSGKENRNQQDPSGGSLHKSSYQVLISEIVEGLAELERPATGLSLSGLSAGLDIGFSVLLIATAVTLFDGRLPAPIVELVSANLYAVGFVFVVVGRSELFTEHTTLAVFPVLDGRATVGALARLWGLVYGSNLVGAAIIAGLIVIVGPALGTIEPAVLVELALETTDHPVGAMILSAMLAGWLMGLMSWLASAARETVSQLLLVWLVAASIGLAGLHHCIVGSVEVLAGVFTGSSVTPADFGRFLFWSTLGNAAGGVVFVALVKFGHAVRPGSDPDPDEMTGAEGTRARDAERHPTDY